MVFFYEVDENNSQNVFYDITKSVINKMKEFLLYDDDEDNILKELNFRIIDSHIDFIKFILEKYPYIRYKKTDDIEAKFNKNPLSYIRSLVIKYHPDRYPKNTEEEKKKFVIIHEIYAILNNLYVYYDELKK